MKANLKPANSKARALLKKLQALAERGIDGEKASAQRRVARLKARFDSTAPDSAVEGVSVNDRGVFVMGLYDGMMNEARNVGQRLPSRARVTKMRKAKKHAVTHARGLHIHPYTVALSLGKQIRFSAPLEQITAELEAVTQKHLTQGA